jgi:2-oxoisovalerate dehydrogenase E2 component (dihydrolipoyl transacylase)
LEVEDGAPLQEKPKNAESSSSSSSEDEGNASNQRTPLAPNPKLEESNNKALATPAVRSIARRHGIDISHVKGTGKDKRVMKEDILAFINNKGQAAPESKPASTNQVKMTPLSHVRPEDQVKKLTGIKKAMTRTMTESRSIPFFTFSDEIDCTALLKLRQQIKQSHKSLTILPFFVKAASIAMNEFPIINSNFNPETDADGLIQEYVIKRDHNFSIAIDSKDGLTVPNVKRVQDKSILQINSDIANMRERVDAGKLVAADFEEATFSISSVGNIGGTYFVPTILRP